jgi:class I fructose-bisphosphate aldolase
LIMGRKAFQRPLAEGVDLIQRVQNIYLDSAIAVA